MSYGEALGIQSKIAAERKQGSGVDHLLFVEHPHVITIGRNGHQENLLAPEETLRRAGIELYESDRGGDVTYHGPGQIVAYPIMDLREWKRDVGAFVRAIEQVLIDTLADFGIEAKRIAGLTGVWTPVPGAPAILTTGETASVGLVQDKLTRSLRLWPPVGFPHADAKIAAIGVHLSRWISTHGWALNVSTDLQYFQYIVPCGLAKPVTSMAALGVHADTEDVKSALIRHFGQVFDFSIQREIGAQAEGSVVRIGELVI